MDITIPTLQQVRLELQGRLLCETLMVVRLFGLPAACRMINKELSHRGLVTEQQFVESIVEKPDWMPGIHDIKLDELAITHLVEALYVYAFKYRHPLGLDPQSLGVELEHLELLLERTESDAASIYLRDDLLMGDAGEAGWTALPTLVRLARARQTLDDGQPVSVQQLALLAHMTEKSVRAALKIDAPSSAFAYEGQIFDNVDAQEWLTKRREFVATEFQTLTRTPWDHPATIATLHDLGNYFCMRWHGLQKTPESLVDELGWSVDRVGYLKAIQAEPNLINPIDCEDLARSLLVDPRWFTEQVMRLKYPKQVERLLERQAATQVTTAAPAPEIAPVTVDEIAQTLGRDKASTRLLVVLHDGSQLLPVRMKRRGGSEYTFRLGDGSKGSNTLEGGLEVKDESAMIDLVVSHGHSVRMAGGRGGPKNLIKLGRRVVKAAYLDGKLISSTTPD